VAATAAEHTLLSARAVRLVLEAARKGTLAYRVEREVVKAAEAAAVAARAAMEAPATKRGGVREGERHTRGLFVTAV
jgi:hypothetical protein